MFVRGDYEDTDLCLRLRELNREIWYLPDVELYHLEGQSYPTAERAAVSEYNRWLHTQVWGSVLEDLSAKKALATPLVRNGRVQPAQTPRGS